MKENILLDLLYSQRLINFVSEFLQTSSMRFDNYRETGHLLCSPLTSPISPHIPHQPPLPSCNMAYHPLFLQRPTDFSVNSLLTQSSSYLPGLGFPSSGSPSPYNLFPKFPGSLAPHFSGTDDILSQSSHMRNPLRSMIPEEDGVVDDPKVTLETKELWEKFHKFGTEMVITKCGR